MADINQIITLGLGVPSDIEHLILFGLNGSGAPIPPIPIPIFEPLDLEECLGNEKDLSAYGGETPEGIPDWEAYPGVTPVFPAYDPLDVENCIGSGKSISIYTDG